MKIIKKDLKSGKIVVRIEVVDDLWYLSDILSSGDTLISKTKRRMENERGLIKAERAEKVTITLGIEIEKVEFDPHVDRLRVHGTIVSGPENIPKGSAHTINVHEGLVLTIVKEEWSSSEMLKLKDAQDIIHEKVLLAAIEDGECALGWLRNYGIKSLGEIKHSISGKKEVKQKEIETTQFFAEIVGVVNQYAEGLDRIIIAGPGFVKDGFVKYVKEKKVPWASKTLVESVSMGGNKGLEEIVKRGIIGRVVKDAKMEKEIAAIEKLFEAIKKDEGLSAYGLKEVQAVTKMGAVETLLVTNELLREYKFKHDPEIENVLKTVEGSSGSILIVSGEHEESKRLHGLGGIAALLRYRV